MADEMNNKEREAQAKWYVIHTYSGHENKVKATMESMVHNRGLEDYITDIQIPMETYFEMKDGKRVEKERKLFPSYVLVRMIMNDDVWYLVRNTRGVTGFVGPGSKPVPLTDEEVRALGVTDNKEIYGEYEPGEHVRVTNGPFEEFVGVVEETNYERGKVKVSISMFGRDTSVELDFSQIEKM